VTIKFTVKRIVNAKHISAMHGAGNRRDQSRDGVKFRQSQEIQVECFTFTTGVVGFEDS